MKMSMSSKERMIAAIRCQEVDHIPLGQLFHSTVLSTPVAKRWGNQFQRAEVLKNLGLDPVIDIWMPTPESPTEIAVHKWQEDDPDGPDVLLCAEYETPAGKLIQKVRKTRDWYHPTHYRFLPDWQGHAHREPNEFDEIDMMDDWFTRRYKVPLISGPADLDKLEYLLQPPIGPARDEWIANARKAQQYADEMELLSHTRRLSVGDWFMWLCLIEEFLYAMIEQPDYVSRFYEIIQRYNREILELVLEAEPDVVQYRGWYDTPDYWGRERYQQILQPHIEELGQIVHDAGKFFCVLMPEGYTLYRDILDGLPVDVYLGLEPLAARKSEDFASIKAALDERHCIWGGVNAPVTVGRGSDEEIDEAVKFAVEMLGPTGLILNASMYLYDDDVPWDRFMVFIEAWRRYA